MHGHRVETYCLRSLVLINGYASLDAELTANLTSTENVFQCLLLRQTRTRPRLLQTISALQRIRRTRRQGHGVESTQISQSNFHGRSTLILKGAMLHLDLTSSKTNLKACRGVPMIVVHSTENKPCPRRTCLI